MQEPFIWDFHSDQPYQLQDRNFKKAMRKHNLFSLLKTALTALVVLPFALLFSPFVKKRKINAERFFAMGVDIGKEADLTPALLEELGVKHILVRCKLWERDRLEELRDFIITCKAQEVTVNVLQDREHIEDLKLLKNDLRTVFNSLDATRFQIGSAINRAKWGFFSVNEYLAFFKTAYDLQRKEFPHIELLGSGVIDFEYHFTAHTLFNFCRCRYGGVAALLYVDRRGAPENTQMGFDLRKKIALLASLAAISPKSKNSIYITETNWPLTGTAPYAPTSEFECVDEESYANFLVRYYLLAFATQKVDAVCWHQLIAPGYGLIDNREGIRKRTAFTAFKTMFGFLTYADFISLDVTKEHYTLTCKKENMTIEVHWALAPVTLQYPSNMQVFARDGKTVTDATVTVSDAPLYFLQKDSI
jgi:hypothetical protein